jgi:short-subunit dehydrogenase
MNFSVVRGADTIWGEAFAAELARQRRHLILIGENPEKLDTISLNISSKYNVNVHYICSDDSSTACILKTCEEINTHFQIDMLINYTETGFAKKFEEYAIYDLEKKLKTNHLSGILYAHQLLPNLMLHGNSCVVGLQCSASPLSRWQQALALFHIHFADHLTDELTDSGLRFKNFSVVVPTGPDNQDYPLTGQISGIVRELLHALSCTPADCHVI